MEPVEVRLVVFVGRTRKGTEGAVRVDRADQAGPGRQARRVELVPDRDRARRLRRHQQLEVIVLPQEQDQRLGLLTVVHRPEEPDDLAHELGWALGGSGVEKWLAGRGA